MTDDRSTVLADPFPDGTSASVAGYDGTVIATVSRQITPAEEGDGSVLTIAVDGDIDPDSAPLVQAALIQALQGWAVVCLDLSQVEFFGAAGVSVILAMQCAAASAGHRLRLTGIHGLAEHVLTVAGLAHLVTGRTADGLR